MHLPCRTLGRSVVNVVARYVHSLRLSFAKLRSLTYLLSSRADTCNNDTRQTEDVGTSDHAESGQWVTPVLSLPGEAALPPAPKNGQAWRNATLSYAAPIAGPKAVSSYPSAQSQNARWSSRRRRTRSDPGRLPQAPISSSGHVLGRSRPRGSNSLRRDDERKARLSHSSVACV